MRNVRALIAYDGSRYFGWQRQAGFESVQEELESALAGLVGDAVTVHGSGRTDAQVHALGQVASFHVDTRLDDFRLREALNAHLPDDVVVRRLETCGDDFHARFSARGKRYAYVIHTSRTRPPWGREHVHWVRERLDLEAMRRALVPLVGEHDFRSFASAGSPRRSTVRQLEHAHLVARQRHVILVVQGTGFLYNMVRNLVGTVLDAGRGKLSAADVAAILAARDRRLAAATAPATGLYLLRVLYREPVFRGADAGRSGPPGVFPR